MALRPFSSWDLTDSWVFADLSLWFFMVKSKQKELKKKDFDGLSFVEGKCSWLSQLISVS